MIKKFEDHTESVAAFLSEHINLLFPLLFLFCLITRIYLIPELLLRQDAFVYLIKTREILHGNFIPIQAGAMGWPFVASLFLAPFKNSVLALQEHMIRFASAVIGALIFFPLYSICKKLFSKNHVFFTLLLFSVNYIMLITSVSGMSESLFTLFFLYVIYFLMKIKEGRKYSYLAAALAALCAITRVNGLFVIAIVLASVFVIKEKTWKEFFYILCIYLLILTPYLGLRTYAFGSPFNFGGENGFLLGSGQEAWSPNTIAPSLLEFLKTNSLPIIANKLFFSGLVKITYSYIFVIIGPLFIFPFLIGLIELSTIKEKSLKIPLLISFFFWIALHIPLYGTFTFPRYLYPTIPLILICVMLGVTTLLKENKYRHLYLTLFLLVSILFAIKETSTALENVKQDPLNKEASWAKWIAEHIQGQVAVLEGQSHIIRYLPDAKVQGKVYTNGILTTSLYPFTKDLKTTLEEMKRLGIDYAVIDEKNINLRPALKPLLDEKNVPRYFRKVFDNTNSQDEWKVKVYKIEWQIVL